MRWSVTCGAGICLAAMTCAALVDAAELVVSAPPKTPEEERQALHVPPGFEVQLVASEPDIHKPINIAFDDRGRLWVTDTVEYPFPAPEGAKTRDTVKILDDFDENGKARKITTFADNLNIPIGVLPQGDNAAIVYSIPYIWKMTDTHGTGRADKREVLLGTYAHDDTHGMTGSFTEGFDGWIYAVHGFRNTSTVKASDGSQIAMNSGNTYRFRRDGSHIEYYTHGQVNPFGLCFDPLGNLFSSDCETMPITLLIRESYHPSFGKPHDGLGFTPEICDHMYGSTAIAGLCDYVADQFPPEYRNRMFVGNVVTNRINDAMLTPRGSGFHADDVPDFVVTDDGWFRPVNIKLGPDGALYVSDFYNRIIGHYEVDLHHPGRDKQRGRIFRIVYKGNGGVVPAKKFDLTRADIGQLIDDLASPNLTIRMMSMNRVADVIGQPAAGPLKLVVQTTSNPFQKVHGMWVLFRLGALEAGMMRSAAADPHAIVRTHVMRMLGEMHRWESEDRELALTGLKDADPTVRRVAAEALGRHAAFDNFRPLLDLRQRGGDDPFLTYGVRIALRDQLLEPGVCEQLAAAHWNEEDERDIADVAAGAPTPGAAAFLLHHVQNGVSDRESTVRYLRQVARYIPPEHTDSLADFVASKFAGDLDLQLALFNSIEEGLAQRGAAPGAAVKAWGSGLAAALLAQAVDELGAWTYRPLPGSADSRNPWAVQMRISADNPSSLFMSSNVHAETLTGIVRSRAFTVPPTLSFFLAGHNGPPPRRWPQKNFVQVVDAKTGQEIARAVPPRNDIAQKVTWDLSRYSGREAYFEATDGDNARAYAWLAFGRFDPPLISIPVAGARVQGALRIVESLHLTPQAAAVEKVLGSDSADAETRAAAARALAALGAASHVDALAGVVRDPAAPDEARTAAADALGPVNSSNASAALVEAVQTAPEKLQLTFAKALAASAGGAEALLNSIQQGKASPRLLQDANVLERLNVAKVANLDDRVKHLTQGLPAADAQLQKLIDERAAAFNPATASADRGKLVFQKTCAVCHTIAGQGARVGPQLDGIGVRGVPRLCEDILDPSRNVDAAFRYSTFVLDDQNILAGIPRREEGQLLVIADSTGKEIPIPKSKIVRRVESKLSLMPSNFGEVISPSDFDDLMAYLLAQKQK